jgi:ribosomal RNA-processing protein 1
MYLSNRSSIPTLDLLKLWKGLFYCLWMQDKPALQQRLSRDLASIVNILHPDVVLPFLDSFWKTIAREWGHIEALRMDKYLYLIRQYLNTSFRWLSQGGWKDRARIEEYMKVLEETPANTKNPKIPNGLRYHLLDIYVEELEKVGGEEWDLEVLEMLLGPLRKLQKESVLKSIRNAAKEALDDDRLKVWRGEEVKKDDEDELEGLDEEMDDAEGWKEVEEEDEEEEWGGIRD